MKTTYRRDNLSAKRKLLIVGIIFLLGTLVLLYGPARVLVSRMMYIPASKILAFGNKGEELTNIFLGEFRLKRLLVSENDFLREEVSRMQVQVLDRNLLEEKVFELEDALGRTGNDNRIVAQVLAGPGRSAYDTLVIDVGEKQGVSLLDQVVYVGAGVIGEIVEVYSTSAKVRLFSSPGDDIAVLIGAQAIPAMARGRGMGNFEADVPQGSLVLQGEEVVIPGKKLILGLVGTVEEKPSEPFIRVLFRTPFNIAEIRSVEVIKNEYIK